MSEGFAMEQDCCCDRQSDITIMKSDLKAIDRLSLQLLTEASLLFSTCQQQNLCNYYNDNVPATNVSKIEDKLDDINVVVRRLYQNIDLFNKAKIRHLQSQYINWTPLKTTAIINGVRVKSGMPTSSGNYFVALKDGNVAVDTVDIDVDGTAKFVNYSNDVIAWAQPPKYEPQPTTIDDIERQWEQL